MTLLMVGLSVSVCIGGFFVISRILKLGDDDKTSPEIEEILKEIKNLREDMNRKEKALIDLLQELNKE